MWIAMDFGEMFRLMSTTMLWLVIAADWALAALGQTEAQMTAPHESLPTLPWMARPGVAPAGAIAHCGAWERDGYKSIQVNVDAFGCNILGDAANEPSIAVSATDPRKIVIGWRQFNSVTSDFREPGWAYSHDGGHTWVFRGSLDPGVFGSDPVVTLGPEGQIYYLTINFDEMRLFQSSDAGLTWPLQTQVIAAFYDKPWTTVDLTSGPGRGNIYIVSPSRVFVRSTDAGMSFAAYSATGGNGFTVNVGPDGSLWIVDGSFNLACPPSVLIRIGVSDNASDAALTPIFERREIMLGQYAHCAGQVNPGGLLGQPWIATDHFVGPTRGNVYALTLTGMDPKYPDPPVDPFDIVFVRSTNDGKTWSSPLRVNDDPYSPTSLQWFNTMSVAPNGRIDVAWNDTRNSGVPNVSELYYTYSTDGGETFAPNIPVSPPFDSTVGWPYNNPKIGDYYHMVSDNLGVNVAYAATFNGEQDIYFLRIGPWDCNGNETDDALDISDLRSRDCNANDVPDECEYRADVNGDGLTTLSDFVAFQKALTGPLSSTQLQSTIDNRQSTILCPDLLDPDHDGDIDLHDLYLFQQVYVKP